jgi:hypothetical protein
MLIDYSAGLGASTGQTPAQAPQSVQSAASMTKISSPSLIAETGHSPSQAPQLMHSELITYAMYNIPFFLLTPKSIYQSLGKKTREILYNHPEHN